MFLLPPPRRHPLQTVPFWLLLSAGALVLGAWKLGWLPLQDFATRLAPLVVVDAPGQSVASKPATQHAVVDSEDLVTIPDSVHQAEPKVPALLPTNHLVANHPAATIQAAAYEASAGDREAAPAQATMEASTPSAPAPATPAEQLNLARSARDAGDDIAAHRGFSTVYWQHPELRPSFQSEIDVLADRIYFQRQQHYIPAYRIEPGDHLASIARRYQVSWEYLSRLNQVQPEKIQAGRTLKVLQGPFTAIVDLSRFELTVHAFGYYVRRYPVGIGRDGATPVGTFQVVDKVVNPIYYGPDGVVAADDPANPLGERWLAINDESGSLDGYGIHGTIEPESIGKAASRGCIRMRDADLLELYDLLTVGSEVTIRR